MSELKHRRQVCKKLLDLLEKISWLRLQTIARPVPQSEVATLLEHVYGYRASRYLTPEVRDLVLAYVEKVKALINLELGDPESDDVRELLGDAQKELSTMGEVTRAGRELKRALRDLRASDQ